MIPKKKAERVFLSVLGALCSLACFAGAASFPLELKVVDSPCLCGGSVHLFSSDGRNQTLKPGDEAPNCNLMPLYPALPAVCAGGIAYVADKSGKLYSLTPEGPLEVLSFKDEPVGLFVLGGRAVLVTRNAVIRVGGGVTALSFEALSACAGEDSLFVFGEEECLVTSGEGATATLRYAGSPDARAVLAGGRIVAGAGRKVDFFNSRRKVFRKFALKADVVSMAAVGDKSVAVASSDHVIRLFDLRGNVIWQKRLDGRIAGLWRTEKGLVAAVGGAGSIHLLDTEKGRELWKWELKEGEMGLTPFSSGDAVAFYSFSDDYEPFLNLVDLPR